MDILNLIFPSKCVNCGKWGEWICDACIKRVKPALPECYVCRRLNSNYITHTECLDDKNRLEQVIILNRYNEIIKNLMIKLKFDGSYRIANFIVEKFVLPNRHFLFPFLNNSYIVPVPSNKSRNWSRGFSQTEILLKLIISKLKLTNVIYDKTLVKSVWSGHQAKLSRSQRQEFKNRFVINDDHFISQHKIIIFDDVISTGSTINEVANLVARKTNGKLFGFALFRGKAYWQI